MLSATGTLLCGSLAEAQQYAPQTAQPKMVEFGSANLRPVSEFTAAKSRAAASQQASARSAPRSPVNETLRWGPSPEIKPQPHHIPSQDVFADNVQPAAGPNSLRHARTAQYYQPAPRRQSEPRRQSASGGTVMPARHEMQHGGQGSVQQAAWSNEARAILDEALSHQGDSPRAKAATDRRVEAKFVDAKEDFFGNPFGDQKHTTASAKINSSATSLQPPSQRPMANQQFNDFDRVAEAHGDSGQGQIRRAVEHLANQFQDLPPVGGTSPAADGPANTLRGLSGDDALSLPAPNATPNAATGRASSGSPGFDLPAPTQATPAPSSVAPPIKGPASGFDNLFDDESLSQPNAQPNVQPKAPAAPEGGGSMFDNLDGNTQPGNQPQESQLRDYLESVDRDDLKKDASGSAESLEELPRPNAGTTDSPSDRDDLFKNPFPNRTEEEDEADKFDRDRLQDRMDKIRSERSDKTNAFGSDDPEDDGKKSQSVVPDGLTCDEFRQRISRETIRTLSLDISAPFRPDVFDIEEFEELKGKFDENQPVRQWTAIDGSVVASGRLRDLAYEKAIIETDQGTQQEIQVNRLSEGDLAYISQNWGLPKECRLEQVAFTPRNWQPHAITWKASNLCHKPLYFQEVNLERYGHTAGPILQPVVSSAHFFANIAVLPYKMGIHPPSECQYALGYYRPGNCAPWIIPPVPLSLRGAAAQAAAVTTGFLLIP